MAAVQSSSLLARHRSTRTAAVNLKPPAAPTTATNSTPSSASTPLGLIPSNVSTFLTNLRLLDLDLLPDWPDISSLTFSTRDSGQGQKRRIQCVEWALYQLFALWDPEETRNRLQPYFPPTDQVQSLNLRAGLLRALDQAKKNGILGRDAVVRKTMLDECKGDRLEEALAVFSSAVVRRLAAEEQVNGSSIPTLAQTLALQNRSYSSEQADLGILVLAHTVSMRGLLREKERARAKYEDFSELLDLKERSISRRREQARAARAAHPSRENAMSNNDKLSIQRTVRNNWSGNEGWTDSLLRGDTASRRDGLLTTSYDRVWRRVESGRLIELEDRGASLLEQLDRRVRVQKERLKGWEDFCTQWLENPQKRTAEAGDTPTPKQRGIDLGFTSHERLRLGRLSPRKLASKLSVPLPGDYAALVEGLNSDLKKLKDGDPSIAQAVLQFQSTTSQERLSVPGTEDDPISELSDLEEDPIRVAAPARQRDDELAQTREPISQKGKTYRVTVTQDRPTVASRPVEPQEASRPRTAADMPPPRRQTRSPTLSPVLSPARTPSPVRRPVRTPSPIRLTPVQAPQSPQNGPSPEAPPPVSPTQKLADQVLASMNNTSPSPAKKPRHTLSLAERTRLSMARGTLGISFMEEDEPDLAALSIRRKPHTVSVTSNGSPHVAARDNDDQDGGHEDLVARTRKSMAGFEAARQRAQLERRRSQRKSRQLPSVSISSRQEGSSYFPTVEEGDSTILAEELMSGEQDDAEAIFKSRPKIKNSPVTSPSKDWA